MITLPLMALPDADATWYFGNRGVQAIEPSPRSDSVDDDGGGKADKLAQGYQHVGGILDPHTASVDIWHRRTSPRWLVEWVPDIGPCILVIHFTADSHLTAQNIVEALARMVRTSDGERLDAIARSIGRRDVRR